jgi:hypothetical protein
MMSNIMCDLYKPTDHQTPESVIPGVGNRIGVMINGFVMMLPLTVLFSLAKLCNMYKDHGQVSCSVQLSTMYSPPLCDLNYTAHDLLC